MARFGASGAVTASNNFCAALMPASSAGELSTSASTARCHGAGDDSRPSATKRAATSPPMLWPSSTSGPACSARTASITRDKSCSSESGAASWPLPPPLRPCPRWSYPTTFQPQPLRCAATWG